MLKRYFLIYITSIRNSGDAERDNTLILVTGGGGFIGSNFVRNWINTEQEAVVVLDKLTYAGNFSSLSDTADYHFVHGDINNSELVSHLLTTYRPRALINFAAETHVDRSIHYPNHFIQTNINGTFSLLEMSRQYWLQLSAAERAAFRFLQISTDEVYGSLSATDAPFQESSRYAPNNPYSASKAAADHLVRAYYHTYGLPTLITNCSNNYGPYQFPEKLIPFTIANALANKPITIYGDGLQIRDWLYVADHCTALCTVLANGQVGETYNIGAQNEITNLALITQICETLDELMPSITQASYKKLMMHVKDRPGHDKRYALDATKIMRELNWKPQQDFLSGLRKTILWYLNNKDWVMQIRQSAAYEKWLTTNYMQVEII